MSGCGCAFEARNAAQRRTLRMLLGINAVMFFVELGAGWYAQSTGLMADALDMFADALVYGLSLWAVGRAAVHKARTARISGWLQVALGLGVLAEVVRRFVWGSEPEGHWMLGIGLLAPSAAAALATGSMRNDADRPRPGCAVPSPRCAGGPGLGGGVAADRDGYSGCSV